MDVKKGEVIALIGGNGAGKSTLMKIIMGIYDLDEGEIFMAGQPVKLGKPSASLAQGIYLVPQEPMLFPNMTVLENVLMGFHENEAELKKRLQKHMEELGLLNDEDYARRLANELFTRKKFGARRVKQELHQKGIDDALIAAVMDEFSTERSETEENIRAILERKYPMAREDEKVRRRAVAALQRYGYGFDEIFSVLNSEE